MKILISYRKSGGIKELLQIAFPLIVSYACDTVMMFCDRLFLSRLSGDHMSAAMAGGLTAFMCTTFFIGIIGYTTAMAAQQLGAGRPERCGAVTAQGGIVALIAYPIMPALIPLVTHLFAEAGLHPTQLSLQTGYFGLLMWGSLVPLLRAVLSNFFSGVGRTRVVMLAAVVSMSTNVGLNYVLIFGKLGFPALGINGAAIGTIVAGALGLLILIAAYLRRENREMFQVVSGMRWNRGLISELIRLGTPSGVELFLNLVAFTVLVTLFHARGETVASAVTITFNWDMVGFIPLLGVNVAVTSLVGRYVGKKQLDTAHRAVNSGLWLGCGYMFCLMVLFLLAPGPLVDLFRPSETGTSWQESRTMAVVMVQFISVYLLADAVSVVFSGALRGAGDTFWTMVISVANHWLLAAVTYISLNVLETTAVTAWAALVLTLWIMTSILALRYYRGNWRKRALQLGEGP
jgi:multidrug resistance protein, MATE family